jgi:hypothetical protein
MVLRTGAQAVTVKIAQTDVRPLKEPWGANRIAPHKGDRSASWAMANRKAKEAKLNLGKAMQLERPVK